MEIDPMYVRLMEAVENFDYNTGDVNFRAFDIHDLARKIFSADPFRSKPFCFLHAFSWYGYYYDDIKTRKFVKYNDKPAYVFKTAV